MHKLGDQWIEEIDGKKHMLKAVLQPKQRSHLCGNDIHPCFKCLFQALFGGDGDLTHALEEAIEVAAVAVAIVQHLSGEGK